MGTASEPSDAGTPGPRAHSLRWRLTAWVLGASVAMWMVGMGLVVHAAWRETSEVFDDALEEGARLVQSLGRSLDRQGALVAAGPMPAADPSGKLKLHYQIVSTEGRVLRRAEQAPAKPFSSDLQRRSGHADVWADGRAWRVYLLRAEGQDFQVQMGQPWEERLDLLEEMAERLAWPALGMFVLLAAFCGFAIRRLLQPLERTAARIAAKSPDELAPVPFDREPRELRPIVVAFNGVLARLSTALQAERRFTADAAHELRTPLAALRMRIQLLQRQRGGDGARARAVPPEADDPLRSLRDDVDRCTALVESLLALARLDPDTPQSLATESVDLPPMFARLRDELAGARGDLRFETHCEVETVRAHATLLQTALRNLVDNAARYGPPGCRIRIESVPLGEAGVRIAVRDDGPGVSPQDRQRLTERFFRVLGTGAAGSGLGLSIVARIAALHRADLRFEAGIDGAGLGVVMDFGSR